MSNNNTNNNKQELVFVPGTSLKEFTFANGGSVLRLSLNVSRFAEFVKQHKNEAGYINFNINRRREVGQFGDTHNMTLDLWKPEQKKTDSAPTKSAASKKTAAKPAPAPEPEDNEFV